MAMALGTTRVRGRRGGCGTRPVLRQTPSAPTAPNTGRDIVLLSVFDGVDRDFGRPRLAVSWEVDRACKALVQEALPWVEHRGDLTRDSPQDVAELLDADPNAEAMVVWCAAPPCQDFSRIATGAGHQGDRGRLFEESVAFMDELRAALKSHRFAFLYENVEMGAEAAKVSSDALGVQPVFVCSSDFGWGVGEEGAVGPTPFGRGSAIGRFLRPRRARVPLVGGPGEEAHAVRHDTDARWMEGGRQFALWHYTVEAMLQDSKGVLHIPPPEVKEQLHHIPGGCTARAGADVKTRHRMVRNGWHWGVASHSRLLGLLVMATWAKPVASGTSPAPAPRQRDQWLSQFWARREWDLAPPPRPEPQVLGEGLAAARMQHSLEPALEAILEFRREWRHVLEERHGRLVGHPARPRAGVGYPAADDLRQDVDTGFDMLGPVRSAPGLDRRRENPTYVARKAARPRDQEHTRALLDELVAETRLGRVMGPCAAPDHWSVSTVALPSLTDMGVLRQQLAIASRADPATTPPWRRLTSRPTSFWGTSSTSSCAPGQGWDPVVFGHDLQNGTFLPSAAGVTLWFHFAMCFGAAASVWNFNRAADAVQMLLRSLLLVLLGHFVDDFNGVDAADLADSAHHAVADFFALLGLQTKPSKAQAPAKRHVVQGVELSIRPEGVELSPTALKMASRLAGRLTFLSQSTFGATGRAAIKPLYSRAADTAANSDGTLSHQPNQLVVPGGGTRGSLPPQTVGGKDLTMTGRDALRRDVGPLCNLGLQAYRVCPGIGDSFPNGVRDLCAAEVGAGAMQREPEGVPGPGRWLWFRVPYPARPGRSTGGNDDFGGGNRPDCPGDGPTVELVAGVEVEEAAGREDAEDDAGVERDGVGAEAGKEPEPGAGVDTSGSPPAGPCRR
ncbi:unnamed protein product [Symbiodinium microadriaticum]|nr:unnamed protein product [Symbiodinium microadriaticum]